MELFRKIQEANALEVWTISIATSPPQLVVVKDGFRNVVRNALFGANYQSPGNAGLETFFWDDPTEPPAVVAEIKRVMTEIDHEPAVLVAKGRLDAVSGPPGPDSSSSPGPAGILRFLILGSLGMIIILAAFRHPFIGRRLLLMVPTLTVVSVAVFFIIQLPPGDFASTKIIEYEMMGTTSSLQMAEDLRKNFNLDQPAVQRYLHWVGLLWFTSFESADTGLL